MRVHAHVGLTDRTGRDGVPVRAAVHGCSRRRLEIVPLSKMVAQALFRVLLD